MNKTVGEILKNLVLQYGEDLSTDRQRTEGLLQDFCGRQRREVTLLVAAVREGVAGDLRSFTEPSVDAITFDNLCRRMCDQGGYERELSQWSVATWAYALGKEVAVPTTTGTTNLVPQPRLNVGFARHPGTPASASVQMAPQKPLRRPRRIGAGNGGLPCWELHEMPNGCEEEIPYGNGCRFCPRCGRPTGHILCDDVQLEVPHRASVDRSVTLRNVGESEVQVVITLRLTTDAEHHVQLAADQTKNFEVLPHGGSKQIHLRIPPLEHSAYLGELVISASDGPLNEEGEDFDPWQERSPRLFSAKIWAVVERPAEVHLLQESAFFRQGLSSRLIELVNEGDADARVEPLKLPAGYVLATTHPDFVPGQGQIAVAIRREWQVPAPEIANLEIRVQGMETTQVQLHSPAAASGRLLLQAVIGIDFGTAFSSVAFRQCYHRKLAPDEVTFLKPASELEERFPTRLWISKNGELSFASDATEEYMKRPNAGYLFREIKTLLREDQGEFIHPEKPRQQQEAKQLVQEYYGQNWREALVTQYLGWLYRHLILPEIKRRFGSAEVMAKYIFSLPVLDYASDKEKYQLQHQKMDACVRNAGFPVGAYEFQFEPVCAALGLLYPPSDSKWPRLGGAEREIHSGDTIVIFDSGGGTTDVVLAVVEIDENNGPVSLRVERCLGIGSNAETFGGEAVTTRLLEALRRPDSVEKPQNWYQAQGSAGLNLDTILGTGAGSETSDSSERDMEFTLDQRDRAEKLKIELASPAPPSPDGVLRGDVLLLPALLNRLVLQQLISIASELKSRVFTVIPQSEPYYLCVGGNTYLPSVRRWVELFMEDRTPENSNRRLQIPEKYRKLAVAYGAAWVPDARIRNAAPYDLRLDIDTETALVIRRNSSQEVYQLPYLFEMPPRHKATIELKVHANGSWRRVDRCVVFNPYDSTAVLDTVADMQNGVLRVRGRIRDPDDGASLMQESLLEYEM